MVTVPAQNRDQDVLLDVTVENTGMMVPEGKHLYTRIFKDGMVEYEVGRANGGPPQFVLRHTRLDGTRLKSLADSYKVQR
jgi:hypothetical protein